MGFVVIPAVDMRGGKAVRLAEGDFDRETRYFDDPVEAARHWVGMGARRLHLVDLDAARGGSPVHREAIETIARTVGVPVEIGGGVRSMEAVETYLTAGVQWVVVGTAAVEDRDFVLRASARHPGRIILGIDARDGLVRTKAWREGGDLSAVDLARSYAGAGIAAVIYTDIARDGVGTGIDREGTRRMAREGGIPVIASGGVKDISDVKAAAELYTDGVIGVIVGRALYEGTVDLAPANAAADSIVPHV
jgi:phosphoribosylformimino-5-aminoimidazole carboxamide ribotide isomerase